ncbi:MAG TPA: hypothetical protein VFV09_03225 [Actinomycetota bacterium]|jgi:hypothetical protein|nr:hypothetical protein [Actinomycetota bacterium]
MEFDENPSDPIDASQMSGGDRPSTGGENRPGAEGSNENAVNVTIPDPSGEENANSIPVEP